MVNEKKYLKKHKFRKIAVGNTQSSFVSIPKRFAFLLNNKDFKNFLKKPNPRIKNLFEKETGSKENCKFHIQWHLTNTCNLRCTHCYQEDYTDNGFPIQTLKRIADDIINYTKQFNLIPEFSLTGGEPLLVKEKLYELIEYIKLKLPTAHFSILTNGTLLTPEVAKKFKELGVGYVQLSLEASKEKDNDAIRGKGDYKKVLTAIKNLQKEKVRVNLHFVVSRLNAHDTKAYFKKAKELGVNRITFSNLVPMGEGANIRNEVLEPLELKKVFSDIVKVAHKEKEMKITTTRPLWCLLTGEGGYCPVAMSTITILQDGTLLPCRRLDIPIGNILKKKFIDIWFGSEVLWNLRDSSKLKVCGKCKFRDDCKGCRGLAYSIHKDYLAPDPQCWKINKSMGVLK